MWLYFRLFLLTLRLLRRDRRDLVLESLALRQQLAVFERPRRPRSPLLRLSHRSRPVSSPKVPSSSWADSSGPAASPWMKRTGSSSPLCDCGGWPRRMGGKRADLEGANLEGAYLVRAKLERADLEGANLDRANLEGARRSPTGRGAGVTTRPSSPMYPVTPLRGVGGQAMKTRLAGLLGVVAVLGIAVGVFGAPFDGRTAEAVRPGATVTGITATIDGNSLDVHYTTNLTGHIRAAQAILTVRDAGGAVIIVVQQSLIEGLVHLHQTNAFVATAATVDIEVFRRTPLGKSVGPALGSVLGTPVVPV